MRGAISGRFLRGMLILLFPAVSLAQTLAVQGLLSSWMVINRGELAKTQGNFGFRYLPDFSLKKSISRNFSFDGDISLNFYSTAKIFSLDRIETVAKTKLYRLHLRFSSPKFEARLGLQKINFGSAMLLRPLMWFDRVDPRDPLQITDGVYGLLFRYYFLNNSNVWLWALYGNDEAKGWEAFPTAKRSIEYGGRFQTPLPRGEMALTYHHRRMNSSKIPENRFGLDGKWDIGIGAWFEGTLIHYKTHLLPFPYQRAANIGLDYTFGLGHGLHILGEHFVFENAKKMFGQGEGFKFTALSLNYPLGLLDSLTGIFYYDWKNKKFYRFFNWQRKYDRWTFYFIGFWNPEKFAIYQSHRGNNLFAGKGFQVMVAFNH